MNMLESEPFAGHLSSLRCEDPAGYMRSPAADIYDLLFLGYQDPSSSDSDDIETELDEQVESRSAA